MFKSLEEILQEYFGCKGRAFPFGAEYDQNDYRVYFTKSGAKAYKKLESLIHDLFQLGVFEDLCSMTEEEVIENLDSIVYNE